MARSSVFTSQGELVPDLLREHTLIAIVLSALTLCTVSVGVHRLFFHRLSRIPGPFIAKITGLWRTYRYFNMSWHDDVLRLHKAYGPVVRIAPDEVSIVDAAAMRRLYTHGNRTAKTAWYDTWAAAVPQGFHILFSERDHKIHAQLRRRVSAAYSMTSILKTEVYIQDCLDLCFRKLRSHAERNHVIDMSEWTLALAFDVVGELTYGQKLGHLETETDVDDVRKDNTSDMYWTGNFGHFWFQAKWLQNPVLDAIRSRWYRETPAIRFQNWTYEKIVRRKGGLDGAGREDLLSRFLEMKPLEGRDKLDDLEILIEAVNIISAGADTTSIGMRSCLYYVGLHPHVYRRLRDEIDDFYTSNKLDKPISYLQTQGLPYLKAVVSEATRLLPSIVYQLLRHAPEGGLTVNGHFIPAGTPVGISPIAQNRDRNVWGDDADEFRPERWLDSPEKTSYLESNNMTYGGNGPRGCIGRNLALVELHKFLSQLMRNFDFEIDNMDKPWKVRTYWFMDQLDFNLRLRPRDH